MSVPLNIQMYRKVKVGQYFPLCRIQKKGQIEYNYYIECHWENSTRFIIFKSNPEKSFVKMQLKNKQNIDSYEKLFFQVYDD